MLVSPKNKSLQIGQKERRSYIVVSVHHCVCLFAGEETVCVEETDGHKNVLDAGAKLWRRRQEKKLLVHSVLLQLQMSTFFFYVTRDEKPGTKPGERRMG